MPDYRIMFDRNYLGHLDLGGRDVTLTITKVKGGELTAVGGRKSKKPVIHFPGDIKPLICNKTNAKTIAAMYGNITEQWIGKRITMFTSMTRNPDGGGEVECIRIRPKVPASKADTPLAPRPEPEEHIEAAPPQVPPPNETAGTSTGSPAAVAATITAEEALTLEARCQENGINVASLKKAAGVDRLSMITSEALPRAHQWVDKAIEKRKNAA